MKDLLIWSQLSWMQRRHYQRLAFMERLERLLKVGIHGIVSKVKYPWLLCEKPNMPQIPFRKDSRYCSFHPVSIMMRNDPILLQELTWDIDWTRLLALDRLMKRAEKNDKLREHLLRAMRVANFRFSLHDISLRLDIWHLERYAELIPDSVTVSERGSELQDAFSVVVSAVLHLLAFVFQYLVGCVDRGGSKTYSSGSFDFRATYVSLVLFQGAYVWIKFRQAARPGCRKRKASDTRSDTPAGVQVVDACDLKGVFARAVKDKLSGTITHYKYEPRFKPPREEVEEGTSRRFDRLNLGEYHTRAEAKIVLQIARFYYDKDGGCVELEDGQYKFPIPPMSEQEGGLAGEEKRKWVTTKAKQVYTDLRKEMQNLMQLSMDNRTGTSFGHGNDAGILKISSLASANDLVVPSCPAPLPPCDGTDDYSETHSGFDDMIDELLCPDLPNFSPQQSSLNCQMHYLGFAQILGDPSSPQVDSVTQGIEYVSEPQLSPSIGFRQGWDLVGASGSNFFLKQRDPILQQLVHRQKKRLEDSAIRIVGLEHQLSEYQIQNSELQHGNDRLQQENEHLRTRLQQVVNSQVAAWSGVMTDIQ